MSECVCYFYFVFVALIMPDSCKCPFDPLCAPNILFQLKYLYISAKRIFSLIETVVLLLSIKFIKI